ncbi:low molecular weight protein-tyrosine-phosphatase [Chelativorans intermedius]|uniref:protein-tyrosine-phosphatase n=1 Tax=Chelativorans intermedius TaxID=515947 RepID=A0ABV6D7B4_9HYPH|nr:low molecular weight protein-tyrosine-phosphatase [Chelativorans intermedius]MCT8999265.1 low molecular weight phosphotyrosine protein phosphatase [Chelativorans intermedius]
MKHNAAEAGEQARTAVLFVCLGNICRSPLAEGVFRAVIAEQGMEDAFHVESAGTGAWHVGAPPDPRSIAVARRFGLDISGQRARRVVAEDFSRFDVILGMDRANVRALSQRAPRQAQGRIHLFLDFALGRREDIPDPYYGGEDGFAAVYWRIREASEALATRLRDGSARISGQASSTM